MKKNSGNLFDNVGPNVTELQQKIFPVSTFIDAGLGELKIIHKQYHCQAPVQRAPVKLKIDLL